VAPNHSASDASRFLPASFVKTVPDERRQRRTEKNSRAPPYNFARNAFVARRYGSRDSYLWAR